MQESQSKRIRECEAQNLVNGITLRPIRIGTVTEAIAVCQQAQKLNWGVVVRALCTCSRLPARWHA